MLMQNRGYNMKKKTTFYYLLFTVTLITILAACSDGSGETGGGDSKISQEKSKNIHVSLELEEDQHHYESWKSDSSHQKMVEGSLLVDDKSVVGAEIQISNKRKTLTDENGQFSILLDTNIIKKDVIHVASLDKATINGEALDEQTKELLFALEEELIVYFPIEVDNMEENKTDNSLVDIYAHAVVNENEEFPKFGVEKFPIKGTIKDAKGNPVEGATVNIRRDGVEGFSMSEPSSANGEYAMYYIPEDDENHYLNVYIPSEDVTYTLPEGKAFLFPDDFGITLDITLPEEGTVIKDEPPTLVATSAKGALYKGVLFGLNTPVDVNYSVTVPQRDGSFIVTVPKDVWESNPSFYQINYSGYFENELNLGDTLTSDLIPLPEKDEPNNIITTQKSD